MKLNSVSAIGISVMLLLSSLMLVTGAGSAYAQATGPAKYFAVYYTATSDGSTFVHAGGQTIDIGGDGGVTACYIPDLDTTTYVDGSKYMSYKFAPYNILAYAVDNRLFLIYEEEPQDGDNGQERGDCWEVNPANCTTLTPSLGAIGMHGGGFNLYSPSSFAVVDDSFYFQGGSYYNMFQGTWLGGELNVVNLASGAETQLLSGNDPDNYGSLISAGGNLFRYKFTDEYLTINQIDLDTGKIAKGVQLLMPASPQPITNAAYRDWSFCADVNAFYVAAAYSPGPDTNYTQIYLCTIPLTEFENNGIPNGPDSYWFNVNAVGLHLDVSFRLWGTDACEGQVLLKIANAMIVLYDSNTQEKITIPGEKDNACILYGASNPEALISPSTPTPTSPPTSAPTPKPNPNETPVWVAVGVIVIVLVAVVALFVRRRKGAVSRFPPPSPTPSA